MRAASSGRRLGWVVVVIVVLVIGALSNSGDERESGREEGPRLERKRTDRTDRKAEPDRPRERKRKREDEARENPSGIPSDAKRTRVVSVADGDTVELAGLGSSRIIGVDTPEVYGTAECFGAEASAFTKSVLAPGTTVYYVYGIERTDRYGRDLVYLWLPTGKFFNAMLVESGYAVTLTIPPNVEYADLFRRLAARAREAGRGLWARSTCGGDADLPAGGGNSSGGGSGGAGLASVSGAGAGSGSGSRCEPGYRPCVPRYPPDLDCGDLEGPIRVSGRDPHNLDGDRDGVACE